jgi:hypothetical protein
MVNIDDTFVLFHGYNDERRNKAIDPAEGGVRIDQVGQFHADTDYRSHSQSLPKSSSKRFLPQNQNVTSSSLKIVS